MSFCDPREIGEDICAPYGGSTRGHIACATWWGDVADFGQLDAGGCDVGCAPCLDYPSEMVLHADRRGGKRWLRPGAASRDAQGRQHDLLTNEPWPMPEYARGEFGACYHNTSREQCFNRNVCRPTCWRGGLDRFISTENLPCGDVPVGEPMPDWFPDIGFFGSTNWPPSAFHCRRFYDRPTHGVGLGAGRLYRMLSPGFPRFAQIPYGLKDHRPCSPNAVIACAGQFTAPRTRCESAFAYWVQHVDPGRQHWMADAGCRGIWDPLYLDATSIAFAGGSDRSSRAAADLRTRALAHAATAELPGGPVGTHFDRLDTWTYRAVNVWRRTWNVGELGAADCGVLADDRTIVCQMPGCRAPDGRTITMRCHVLQIEMAATLELHKIREYVGAVHPERTYIEPHARFLASVCLAYTAEGGALPTADDCRWPPAGVRFRWLGTTICPPTLAEWWGYRGRLGIGGTETYPIPGTGALNNQCFEAADGLGVFEIPGWPARRTMDEAPRAHPYVGSVRVAFRTRDAQGDRIAC